MDARYSGVSEYTLNLMENILKLDSENDYRLFYNSARDIKNRMPDFGGYPNVKVIKFSYPNKILNYFCFKFLNFPKMDKFLGADIFFMPHINFISLAGSKKVLTVHDLSFLRYKNFFSWRKNFWHSMVNIKKLVNKFDKIIAISENTKNDIMELCGVDSRKVEIAHSGIGSEFRVIKNDANLSRVKSKYELGEKFILFLGTVEPRKNIEGLILAYNQLRFSAPELRDYKLVIAGGRGWRSGGIYRRWEKSPYKEDIKFLDYIDRNDKPCLYNLASLFVYPSFYEGFGFPPLEAMACGVPVIASFSSSLPEVCGSAALLLDPHDADGMARGMREILSNGKLRSEYISQGLKRAKDFSWENTAKKYLELFKNL